MQLFTSIFNSVISIGVLIMLIWSLYILYCYFFTYETYKKTIQKNTLALVCLVSGLATIASLIYSLVIGFPPCDLCWYQRIFMYPIFVISIVELIKKNSLEIMTHYFQTFIGIGFLIALAHTIVYYTGVNPFPCSATASCTARYVFEFGFVTIPLMSLISFITLAVLVLPAKKK